jgi:hypothetical protein
MIPIVAFQFVNVLCFSVSFAWGIFQFWTKVVPSIDKRLKQKINYINYMYENGTTTSRFKLNSYNKCCKNGNYKNKHKHRNYKTKK